MEHCKTCKHWGKPQYEYEGCPAPCTRLDGGTPKFEITLMTRGWDCCSEVEQIETAPDFGCTEHEPITPEAR